MKDVFRFTPQELRARRRMPDRLVTDGGLELRMPYRPPLAWDALLAFLAPRAIPGVESSTSTPASIAGSSSSAARPASSRCGTSPSAVALRLRVHLPDVRRARAPGRERAPAVRSRRRSRRSSTPRSRATARCDPWCGPAAGCACPARSTRSRSACAPCSASRSRSPARPRSPAGSSSAYGTPVAGPRRARAHAPLPDAATLADADLTEIGLTGARARADQRVRRARSRRARLELEPGRDLDRHRRPSCGACPDSATWTAQYVAMRACGERDAFPAADLGLAHERSATTPRRRAEAWRPWRAYGAMHLWLGSRLERDGREPLEPRADRRQGSGRQPPCLPWSDADIPA